MARNAVAELHARLVADVRPYEAAMQRAASVTAQTAGKIEGQMGELQRNIAKKFSASDIGKDILRGLGIGSGFALAQTAAETLVDTYRQQAEYMREIEQRTAKQLEYTKQLIGLRQTDEQRLETAKRERDSAVARQNELQAARQISIPQFDRRGNAVAPLTIAAQETPEMQAEMKQLIDTVGKLSLEIEKMEAAARAVAVGNALTEFFGPLDEINPSFAGPAAAAERQRELRLQELMLGTSDRSAAQVRGEIGDDDGAAGRAMVRQMGEERQKRMEDWFDRVASGAQPLTDTFMRTGLGTGADYEGIAAKQTAVLVEIRELLRRSERRNAYDN